MKKLTFLLTPIVAALLVTSCATTKLAKGDSAYERMAYSEAITHYERADQDKMSAQDMFQLADSYHFNNQPGEASKWYAAGFAKDPNAVDSVDTEVLVRYAQTLEAKENFDLAEDYYLKAFQRNPEDEAAYDRFLSSWANQYYDYKEERIDIKKMNINRSSRSSMSPMYYQNGIVFTSDRNKSKMNDVHPWTGRPFTEMYYSELNEDGTLSTPEVFAESLQTEFDDGVVTFTPDEKTMYFTRTNVIDGKLQTDRNNEVTMIIMKSELVDGEWSEPVALHFNSLDYNCVHPSVSPDGTQLYFVSDMPGGMGNTDIYIAPINADGTIGEPVNAGYMINTERNELFPNIVSVNGEQELYFSSDGHAGLGGLDIFSATSYNGYWSTPEALPAPINSNRDEFGIIFKGDLRSGYFTSSRDSENGIDAIYSFQKINEGTLKTIVTADEYGVCAPATVTLMDSKGNETKTTSTNCEAEFTVQPSETYVVQVEQDGYMTEETALMTSSELYGDTITREIILFGAPKLMLTEANEFGNVYFDYDESTLRDPAKAELDELVMTLNEDADMTVRLVGHADSRGSDAYNEALAAKRAEATKAYLISKGVAADRITTASYGEDQLVNNCDSEADNCAESMHQQNRRTEIEVENPAKKADKTDDVAEVKKKK